MRTKSSSFEDLFATTAFVKENSDKNLCRNIGEGQRRSRQLRKSSRQGKRETWLIPQLSRRDRTSARQSGYCVPSYHYQIKRALLLKGATIKPRDPGGSRCCAARGENCSGGPIWWSQEGEVSAWLSHYFWAKSFGQAGSNSDEMVNVMLLKGEAEESWGSCCQEDICCRCQQRRSQEKVSTISFN